MTPLDFAMSIWLNTTTKGFIVAAILDLRHMSQVVWCDDWPSITIVNKVSQTRVALPMIMNFPSSHFFMMIVLTWFGIQDILIGWNPMLMNENVLCGSIFIPTLPKFLTYQRSSNTPSPWSSHVLELFHLGYQPRIGLITLIVDPFTPPNPCFSFLSQMHFIKRQIHSCRGGGMIMRSYLMILNLPNIPCGNTGILCEGEGWWMLWKHNV